MTTMDVILLVFSVSYITWVLLIDHYGPFPTTDAYVLQDGYNARPVNILDRFRRLFGVYTLEKQIDAEGSKDLWIVKSQVYLWYCPFCLSFWVQIPLLALYMYLGLMSKTEVLQSVAALPLVAGVIVKLLDMLIDLASKETSND